MTSLSSSSFFLLPHQEGIHIHCYPEGRGKALSFLKNIPKKAYRVCALDADGAFSLPVFKLPTPPPPLPAFPTLSLLFDPSRSDATYTPELNSGSHGNSSNTSDIGSTDGIPDALNLPSQPLKTRLEKLCSIVRSNFLFPHDPADVTITNREEDLLSLTVYSFFSVPFLLCL